MCISLKQYNTYNSSDIYKDENHIALFSKETKFKLEVYVPIILTAGAMQRRGIMDKKKNHAIEPN